MLTNQWETLSLFEQLGNIGAEVARTRHWQGKDTESFWRSVERTLELFYRTLDDPRWRTVSQKGRHKEIVRAREVFCDAVLGGPEYQSSLEGLMPYFIFFAIAARRGS
jgi:hypothetical protein